MLHQISWFTYSAGMISLTIIYYLYVGLSFYCTEIQAIFYKLTGKKNVVRAIAGGDLQVPDFQIMGHVQPDTVEFVAADDLSFAPAEIPDDDFPTHSSQTLTSGGDSLAGAFSDMISESKTLIRVINESGESKENFEMLFRLVIQKYGELRGTTYQDQINDFLLNDGASELPFPLGKMELNNYWTVDK